MIVFLAISSIANTAHAAEGNTWLMPANFNASIDTGFNVEVHMDTGGKDIGAFNLYFDFDPTKVTVDTSIGNNGLDNGADTASYTIMSNADELASGHYRFAGIATSNHANGSDVHLVTIHAHGLIKGPVDLNLRLNELSDKNGASMSKGTVIGSTGAIEGTNAPIITGHSVGKLKYTCGACTTASINAEENQTIVTTIEAEDPNGDTVTFSLSGGADMAQFEINTITGELKFLEVKDFEHPIDANRDNIYEVRVTASDGLLEDNQTVFVHVTDMDDVLTPIYRLYNTRTGTHLYVRGAEERTKILKKWHDFEFTDGVPAFYASLTDNGKAPIYRLYNTKTGTQLYTRGDADRDKILDKWREFEFTDGKPAFYASLVDDGTTPIYRLYNTKTKMHLYTTYRGDVLAKWPEFEFTDGGPAFYVPTDSRMTF